MREGGMVMALDANVVPVGVARGIKGSFRITLLPDGNVGGIANPDAGIYFGCMSEVLHLLHLPVGEGDVVDGDTGAGDANEVGEIALESGEGVSDNEDIVWDETVAWRGVRGRGWGGGGHGGAVPPGGDHATLAGLRFDGMLEAFGEGKGCAGEAFGGVYDNIG